MKITVIEPQTPEEFKQYYNLRFEILRKPWPDDAIEYDPVEVSAAQHIDALVGDNVHNAGGAYHKGEVECPATKIINKENSVLLLAVGDCSQSGGDRLLQQADLFQPCEPRR